MDTSCDEMMGYSLYGPNGSKVESGKTCFDFSKGPVQFTAASEDKTYQKNYWVQEVNPDNLVGAQQLYINSLKDPEAHTEEKNGVICFTREVMLSGYYNYQHDILLINRGLTALDGLSVKLQSNVVELDEYWSLKGKNALDGFTAESIYELTNPGERRPTIARAAQTDVKFATGKTASISPCQIPPPILQ